MEGCCAYGLMDGRVWLRSLPTERLRLVEIIILQNALYCILSLAPKTGTFQRLPIRLPIFLGVGIVAIGEAGWSVIAG